MKAVLEALYHYPVKGLGGQSLEQVDLTAGQGFPGDRAFAFARPGNGFDPSNPAPMPKSKFVMLANAAALARLQSHYGADAGQLTLDDRVFDVTTAQGRREAAAFVAKHLGHFDMGVYAEVMTAGQILPGDKMHLID